MRFVHLHDHHCVKEYYVHFKLIYYFDHIIRHLHASGQSPGWGTRVRVELLDWPCPWPPWYVQHWLAGFVLNGQGSALVRNLSLSHRFGFHEVFDHGAISQFTVSLMTSRCTPNPLSNPLHAPTAPISILRLSFKSSISLDCLTDSGVHVLLQWGWFLSWLNQTLKSQSESWAGKEKWLITPRLTLVYR